jgi:flagellar biosynthesis chaperone FliJ
MPVSKSLRRLLRIREVEEEQCRIRLESANNELTQLQNALQATVERDRRGRQMILASAHTGELFDRLAGMEEMKTAIRIATVLTPRIAEKEHQVSLLRKAFMDKRIELRQAATLIEETEAKDAIEAGRRSQQSLDDWFSSRKHRVKNQEKKRGIPAQASVWVRENGFIESAETRQT